MLSFAGIGLVPLRTEAPRLMPPEADPARELAADAVRSDSGGGVGGKTLRCSGGSDCWRLLDKPGLTRFCAANERLSAGRSSLTSGIAD